MRIGIILAVLIAPATVSAAIVWRGDFETGDIKQWTSFSFPNHATVIQMPVRAGRYAGRTEVHSEDRWPNGLRRVEVVYNPPKNTFQDSERFYGWSMMQSPDMPLSQAHSNAIAYWESDPLYQVIMDFSVDKDKVAFRASLNKPDGKPAGTVFRGDFGPGRWHDFILHVKWSPDPNVGLIELWYDGAKVVDKLTVQTMHNVNGMIYPAFFKMGLMHGDFDADPEALFIDSAIDATTFAEASPGVSDGGVPPMADAARATPDVAPPRLDANVPLVDAGPVVDAAVDASAARDDSPTPPAAGARGNAGCGCRVGQRSSGRGAAGPGTAGLGAAGLLILALAIARRRRRR